MNRDPLPARYPPTGVWPAEMRADLVAGYLDFRDTRELTRAIARGQAPPPTAFRGTGRHREPVWSRFTIDHLVAPQRKPGQDDRHPKTDLIGLV